MTTAAENDAATSKGLSPDSAQTILDSGDFILIKALAKSYYANPIDDQVMLDAFASFLLQHRKVSDKQQADALSWLCRALGASENGRYYTVLLDISRHASSRKLRKYASVSLRKVGYASEVQYLDIYRKQNP